MDIHICGGCRREFHDVMPFVEHKRHCRERGNSHNVPASPSSNQLPTTLNVTDSPMIRPLIMCHGTELSTGAGVIDTVAAISSGFSDTVNSLLKPPIASSTSVVPLKEQSHLHLLSQLSSENTATCTPSSVFPLECSDSSVMIPASQAMVTLDTLASLAAQADLSVPIPIPALSNPVTEILPLVSGVDHPPEVTATEHTTLLNIVLDGAQNSLTLENAQDATNPDVEDLQKTGEFGTPSPVLPEPKYRRTTVTYSPSSTKTKTEYHCTEPSCSFKSIYQRDLVRHSYVHTGEKPFVCTVCEKAYNRKDKLRIHMRSHSGERPFACKLCEYSAADGSSLKKHIRIHSDERPFKCQVCPYASRNSSQLVVHLRTHTGDAPFRCQFCDAKFKINSDLRRHMRVHTREKPWKCELCDYRCSIKSNLNTHHRLNHCVTNMNKCHCCTFESSSRSKFRSHMRTHSSTFCQSCRKIIGPVDSLSYLTDSNTYGQSGCYCTCPCSKPAPQSTASCLSCHKTIRPAGSGTYPSDAPSYGEAGVFCSCSKRVASYDNTSSTLRMDKEGIMRHKSKTSKRKEPKRKHENAIVKSRQRPDKHRPNYCKRTFLCDMCDAAFVRSDSLRSHKRQHRDQSLIESTALAVLKFQQSVIHNYSATPDSTQDDGGGGDDDSQADVEDIAGNSMTIAQNSGTGTKQHASDTASSGMQMLDWHPQGDYNDNQTSALPHTDSVQCNKIPGMKHNKLGTRAPSSGRGYISYDSNSEGENLSKNGKAAHPSGGGLVNFMTSPSMLPSNLQVTPVFSPSGQSTSKYPMQMVSGVPYSLVSVDANNHLVSAQQTGPDQALNPIPVFGVPVSNPNHAATGSHVSFSPLSQSISESNLHSVVMEQANNTLPKHILKHLQFTKFTADQPQVPQAVHVQAPPTSSIPSGVGIPVDQSFPPGSQHVPIVFVVPQIVSNNMAIATDHQAKVQSHSFDPQQGQLFVQFPVSQQIPPPVSHPQHIGATDNENSEIDGPDING